MVEAIAQDRQSCQSVFCLMKNPQLYRSVGQLSASGREHDWLGCELERKTAGAAKRASTDALADRCFWRFDQAREPAEPHPDTRFALYFAITLLEPYDTMCSDR